jgi:hypothetical protein
MSRSFLNLAKLIVKKCASACLVNCHTAPERKPRENSSLGKNPPKYFTDYIVQQGNCRWHCGRQKESFCPALLSSAREMRDIVKNYVTA